MIFTSIVRHVVTTTRAAQALAAHEMEGLIAQLCLRCSRVHPVNERIRLLYALQRISES